MAVIQTHTSCPSCGNAIGWYHLLLKNRIRCPRCLTWLLLDRSAHIVMGFVMAALASSAILVAFSLLGVVDSRGRLILLLLASGLTGSLAYGFYVLQAATLRVEKPKELTNWIQAFVWAGSCFAWAASMGIVMVGLAIYGGGHCSRWALLFRRKPRLSRSESPI